MAQKTTFTNGFGFKQRIYQCKHGYPIAKDVTNLGHYHYLPDGGNGLGCSACMYDPKPSTPEESLFVKPQFSSNRKED